MVNENTVATSVITRKLGLGISILLAAIAFVTNARGNDTILELKDVQFFNARQTNTSPVTIELSGLAFHSALAVGDITTSIHNDSLQILVHLTPTNRGLSGNFDYTISLPATIDAAIFGNEKIEIWNRGTGIIQRR